MHNPLKRPRTHWAVLDAKFRVTDANTESLTRERAQFEIERARFERTRSELRTAADQVGGLTREVARLREAVTGAEQTSQALHRQLRDTADERRDILFAAAEAKRHMAELSRFGDLARENESRLRALHALDETVSQRTLTLEHQQSTVERALAISARVEKMVAAMQVDLERVSTGRATVEETTTALERLQGLATEIAEQLQRGLTQKDELAREIGRLETVTAFVQEFERTRDERRAPDQQRPEAVRAGAMQTAQDVLGAAVIRAARAWDVSLMTAAERGNHVPALDLLVSQGVIGPTRARQTSGVRIEVGTIGYGIPPGLQGPLTIETTAADLPADSDAGA